MAYYGGNARQIYLTRGGRVKTRGILEIICFTGLTKKGLNHKTIVVMIINNKSAIFRNSKQRNALLELLQSTKTHPTASWLYDRLREKHPSLSQGTVYRNLSVLAEQGQIQVLRSGSAFDRFDADTSLHYHVICRQCGRVDDVEMQAENDLERSAAKVSGYLVQSHRLDFFGICPDCQGKNTAP